MTASRRVLAVVRRVRTFSLAHSCRAHPFLWYSSLCVLFVAWANVAQYRRLKPLYPDYAQYVSTEGQQLRQAKEQELAEVQRYNRMVSNMRSDLARRGGAA